MPGIVLRISYWFIWMISELLEVAIITIPITKMRIQRLEEFKWLFKVVQLLCGKFRTQSKAVSTPVNSRLNSKYVQSKMAPTSYK